MKILLKFARTIPSFHPATLRRFMAGVMPTVKRRLFFFKTYVSRFSDRPFRLDYMVLIISLVAPKI